MVAGPHAVSRRLNPVREEAAARDDVGRRLFSVTQEQGGGHVYWTRGADLDQDEGAEAAILRTIEDEGDQRRQRP
jgi:hypothetical protein